ncbi:MAG: hypothetical protein C4297_11590 [Gemmataceae bacterium]
MPARNPRCQIVPQANFEVAFLVEGRERLRWHYGPQYPRPFFWPLIGPSGYHMTRLGHPGAPDHEHHRSIWFGHHKVSGVDFWSEKSRAHIRQKGWLAYEEGDQECVMAVLLGWYDGHDPKELLEQQLIAAVRPFGQGELQIEVQSTFIPQASVLEFGKTNFGFLGVRVAKHLSVYFAGGYITNSNGLQNEKSVFGQPARWVDYSGFTPAELLEGIAYYDHPANPRHPTPWHVREDGWLCASLCMNEPITTTRDRPLILRYLLFVHRGGAEPNRLDYVFNEFKATTHYTVEKSTRQHVHYTIRRAQ